MIAGPGGGLDAIAQGGTGARIFVVTQHVRPRPARGARAARAAARRATSSNIPSPARAVQVARGDGVGLTGGDPDAIERAAPVLDAICPRRITSAKSATARARSSRST